MVIFGASWLRLTARQPSALPSRRLRFGLKIACGQSREPVELPPFLGAAHREVEDAAGASAIAGGGDHS